MCSMWPLKVVEALPLRQLLLEVHVSKIQWGPFLAPANVQCAIGGSACKDEDDHVVCVNQERTEGTVTQTQAPFSHLSDREC